MPKLVGNDKARDLSPHYSDTYSVLNKKGTYIPIYIEGITHTRREVDGPREVLFHCAKLSEKTGEIVGGTFYVPYEDKAQIQPFPKPGYFNIGFRAGYFSRKSSRQWSFLPRFDTNCQYELLDNWIYEVEGMARALKTKITANPVNRASLLMALHIRKFVPFNEALYKIHKGDMLSAALSLDWALVINPQFSRVLIQYKGKFNVGWVNGKEVCLIKGTEVLKESLQLVVNKEIKYV